ncbi:hypothetical protein RRG08_035054 [Elysia crispata]|uniref:FAS1 domain-containing protein n=1 Tax=Elysia crispata TaxID=231223 RepID=A0AAE0ZTH0_9GAST|nr:hypothetical protein RRG08_035054 [Elysia crispata]
MKDDDKFGCSHWLLQHFPRNCAPFGISRLLASTTAAMASVRVAYLVVSLMGLSCTAQAMRTPAQALTDLNATRFLTIAQRLNDQRILGGNTDGTLYTVLVPTDDAFNKLGMLYTVLVPTDDAFNKLGMLYTVLVPTDDAFNKLSQDEQNNLDTVPGLLEDTIGVHIIPGQLFSWDFETGRVIVTDNGHFVRVYQPHSKEETFLNDAKVVRWDEEAEGVVFILIDTVLDAPEGTIYEVLKGPDFGLNVFADMVDQAGQNNTLHRTAGPYTVFVPSQTAWDTLPVTIKDELARNIGLLRSVVQYHIHKGSIHVKNDIRLNSVAGLEEVDIDCDNGVIHIIDHVMFPSTAGNVIG